MNTRSQSKSKQRTRSLPTTEVPAIVLEAPPTQPRTVVTSPTPAANQSELAIMSTDKMATQNNNNSHVELSEALVSLSQAVKTTRNDGISLDKFVAGDDVDRWLHSYANYSELKGWKDVTKVKSFPFHLKYDTCRAWYYNLTSTDTATWMSLREREKYNI